MANLIVNFLRNIIKILTKSKISGPSGPDSSLQVKLTTCVLPALIGALILPAGYPVYAANLTIDGSQTHQTIDGMGVNINVNNWNNGQLKPALDFLITTNGSTLFRVVRDPMDWVASESLITDLHALNPSILQQVYETPKMQDIWNTIYYLNQKGISGRQIILNFMGWTPKWMGGSGSYGVASYISAGKEQVFATMVASLVYYGKRVKGLDFTYLSPMNEEDWNCLEGPCVGTTQYTTIMHDIADELNYMGITDVRFAAPETAGMDNGANYISRIMTDSTVAGMTEHFAFHNYDGSPVTLGSVYTGKDSWLSETSALCAFCDSGGSGSLNEWSLSTQTTDVILGDLKNGFAAVLIWEAFDGFWYHHNATSLWGLLAYNPSTGIYTPRKRAYAYAQSNHFIGPGDVVIGSSESIGSVPIIVAVYNATTGKIAIVGRNSGSSPITINGQLTNLPAVTTLALYETSSSVNLARRGDVAVEDGVFTAQISADAIFSLTNQSIIFDLLPPVLLSATFTGNGDGSVTATAQGYASVIFDNSFPACFNSSTYLAGTQVALNAKPEWNSTFFNWEGVDNSLADTATITINSNRTVSTTFNPVYCVRLMPSGTSLASIQDAYNSATSGVTILAQGISFLEGVTIANSNIKDITLIGGMNDTYTMTEGYSVIQGLFIKSGKLSVRNIKIQP